MSVSTQLVDEPVLSAADIAGLGIGEALLYWRGLPPIVTYLPGVWERKDAQEIHAAEAACREENSQARAARRAGLTIGGGA